MLEEIISYVMARTGRRWKIGDNLLVPTETDVEAVLDTAAQQLLDSPTGQILEVGGLLVERKVVGHAVYVYVGDYL